MLRTLAILLFLASLMGCTAPSPSPGPSASVRPTPAGTKSPPTLPPGVAFVHDGVLEPGRYWFNGFQPWLQLDIDVPGWEVGHFHPEDFDLFLNGTFPSVGFARFANVATPGSSATPGGATVAATSIDAVVDTWRSNPNILVTDVGDVTIAGLSGRAVDLRVTAEQTPLFGSGSQAFKFDPSLDSRFYLLPVEGGVVEVFVVAQTGGLDATLDGTRSIVASLRTAE